MSEFENDAYQAYSKIQSLLDFPESYAGASGLLDTPVADSRAAFASPPSRNYTPQANYTPMQIANTPARNTEDSSYKSSHYSSYKTSNVVATITVNGNEESFERKTNPDEQTFHTLLQQCMQHQSQNGVEGVSGVPAADNIIQAEIAGRYACAAQDRYAELSQEARRHHAGLSFPTMSAAPLIREFSINVIPDYKGMENSYKSNQLQREVLEQRAERDLWSLLEILTASNLLHDIDERGCEEKLDKVLSQLPVTASIPDYVDAAFSVDDRLRKGAVLKEWIEKAALDLVNEAPAPRGEPWEETLNRVLHSRHPSRADSAPTTQVLSLHPDGQLTEDGMLVALDGVDRLDQESLLKTIWQLVRCGHVPRAQQLAAEHRLFWLSASLQGVATHSYKLVTAVPEQLDGDTPEEAQHPGAGGNEEVVGVARVGNLRQPVWLRTCWLYATKLSKNPANFNHQVLNEPRGNNNTTSTGRGSRQHKEDSLVGVLEMSIYGALCNHTKVLLASPLVASWADRVWVYLKAAHERDLGRVVHRYRVTKQAHSKYYAGCDAATIAAERELADLCRLELTHLSTGNCVQIFNKIAPPTAGRNAEFFLLNLQAAAMEGRSGIAYFVENTMTEFLLSIENFPGRDVVFRVFAHFAIWLKYAHNDDAALSELISADLMYLAIEKHIDALIEKKQRSLVAAYAAYLNRPRRIIKYAQLLRSMHTTAPAGLPSQSTRDGTTSGQSADAAEVLQLANVFFPADVMEITRTVVEAAHAPQASQSSLLENGAGNGIGANSVAPASAFKRAAAPPLHSITSPDHVGRPTHSVRFALLDDDPGSERRRRYQEESDDEEEKKHADYLDLNAQLGHLTPAKRSVRSRNATPRRIKGGLSGGKTGAQHSSVPGTPGTPGVGSSIVVFDAAGEEHVTHTCLRLADTSLPVSAHDLQQLESLRWLFFEPSHRIEAVKQANRFVVSFLLNKTGMKLAQVRLLLADYVPFDSVAMGYSLLEQRRNAVQDVEQQYMDQAGVKSVLLLPAQESDHINDLKAELEVEDRIWDAQVSKLHLWRSFTASLQDADLYYRTVADFQAEAARLVSTTATGSAALLGRHRAKLVRTATTAADALIRAVTCTTAGAAAGAEEAGGENARNPAEGFKHIWDQNEAAGAAYVVHTVSLLYDSLHDLLAQTKGRGQRQGQAPDDESGINAEGWGEIQIALRSLGDMAYELYTPSEDGAQVESAAGAAGQAVLGALNALQQLDLPEGTDTTSSGCSMAVEDDTHPKVLTDLALSVVTALTQCKAHLNDVREARQLAGALLFQILTSYLQVCMSAGSVLQTLGHTRDAAVWLSRALRLADLIATEDHSLQLYTLLHRDDLEALLLGINGAALSLLSIDPELNILNA